MLVLKNNTFLSLLPFFIISSLLIIIGICSLIKQLRLLIRGKKVTVRIVKTVPCSGGPNGRRVLTIVAFEYNGETIEKEIIFKRKYIEGYNYKSVYIPKLLFKDELIIGDVSASSLGGELLILDFGIYIFALLYMAVKDYPESWMIVATGIFFVVLIIGIILLKKKRK